MTQKNRRAHPAAELFPLMGEDELHALAVDIKANGLRHPIVLAPDGSVLDGRNRLRACALADVEPVFAESGGLDPLALVVSLNVKRRNLTAGQRAIAAAEAWGMAVEAGEAPTSGKSAGGKKIDGKNFRVSNPQTHFAKMFGSNGPYVQQARMLIEEASDLAASVKSGALLAETMGAFKARKAALEDEAKQRAKDIATRDRLAEEHADLLEKVEAGKMTLMDALAAVSRREEEKAEAERDAEAARQRLRGYLAPLLDHLCWPGDQDATTRRADATATALANFEEMTEARFRQVSQTTAAIADAMAARRTS